MTEIIPPNSPASEQALLGAILIDPEVIKTLRFDPADFYQDRHTWIYESMTEIIRRGQQPDFVTVCQDLYSRGKLTDIGGQAYITGLINACALIYNAQAYADTVIQLARRRRIIAEAGKLATVAYDLDSDVQAQVSRTLETLSRQVIQVRGAVPLREVLSEIWDDVQAAIANPQDIYGVPTGFLDWDRLTHGLQPGNSILLTGDPGIGKSLLAAQVVAQAAERGYPGAYYSLEMHEKQVGYRHLARVSKISTYAMKSGKVAESDYEILAQAFDTLATLPIYISRDRTMSTMDLRIDLARLKDQGIKAAVVDYEALLSDCDNMPDNERSTIISKRIKAIASDLQMPILSIGDMVKAGMTGERKGQAVAAGSGKSIHDRDEIIVMRKDEAPNTILASWEKLREGDGNRFVRFTKLPGFPTFASATKEPNAQNFQRPS